MSLETRLSKLESATGTNVPRIIVAASREETGEEARLRTGVVGPFVLVHTGVPRADQSTPPT